MKKIDIIMPAYNAEEFIVNTLSKLEDQSYKNFRLILIDDCSTDNTKQKIEKYILKTRLDILFLKNLINKGEGKTRNVGIKHIESEYVLFLDCDDYLDKDALKIYYEEAIRTKADIVSSGYCYVDEKGKILKKFELKKYFYSKREEFISKVISKELPIGIGNTLIKSDILLKNNLLFKEYKYGADSYFFRELVLYIKNILILDKNLFYYLNNASSLMNLKFSKNRLDALKAVEDSFFWYKKRNSKLAQKNEFYFNYLYNLELITLYTSLIKSNSLNLWDDFHLNIKKMRVKDILSIKSKRKYPLYIFLISKKLYILIYKLSKKQVRELCKKL